ncbi:MAG: hypothetical protein FWD38_11985 [Oscillospiraceae bacterium]|nr:hypothetical protein [Oscillospiraceae bacterium]
MTTYHAVQRTQERAGMSLAKAERFIRNAVKRGLSADSFKSIEYEYLKSYDDEDGSRAVAYNSYCFIVSGDNICITMFALPDWFGKNNKNKKKKKLRDVTKYSLGCLFEEIEEDLSDFVCA